ncbi:MAG: twin-arginine translocase subunit TatC, partial [Acidimicrobiia bacterium]
MNEQRTDEGRMTLIEHLAELRRRVIVSALVVVTCTVVVFFLYDHILHFLSTPYEHVTRGKTACGGTPTTGCKLI